MTEISLTLNRPAPLGSSIGGVTVDESENQELDVTVYLIYFPGSRGSRDRYGAPEEPDTPDEFEVKEAIVNATNQVIQLTEEETDEAIKAAFDQSCANVDPDPDWD